MNVYLIRHGITEFNEKLLLCGVSDIDISEKGRKELAELKKSGIYDSVEHCYISSLKRTKQTMDIIYPNMPYTVFPGINENSCGDYEGLDFMPYMNSDNEISRYVNHVDEEIAPPNGESYGALTRRVEATFPLLIDDAYKRGFNSIAVIGHGAYFVQLQGLYLGDRRFPNDRYFGNGRGIKLDITKDKEKYFIKKTGEI